MRRPFGLSCLRCSCSRLLRTVVKANKAGTLNSQSLPPFLPYLHYNSCVCVCACVHACVCVCCATTPTVVGRLHPDLLHRISMTPICTPATIKPFTPQNTKTQTNLNNPLRGGNSCAAFPAGQMTGLGQSHRDPHSLMIG